MSKNIYHFFVEGGGERAIINTLKLLFCKWVVNRNVSNFVSTTSSKKNKGIIR